LYFVSETWVENDPTIPFDHSTKFDQWDLLQDYRLGYQHLTIVGKMHPLVVLMMIVVL